jgi:hypothetical protein
MPAAIVGPLNVAVGLPGGVSSAINVTAAGVIKAAPGILASISVVAPGSAGNLTLNDTTSVGGAASTNEILSIPFGTLSAGKVLKFLWPCASGICISAVPTGGQFSMAFS